VGWCFLRQMVACHEPRRQLRLAAVITWHQLSVPILDLGSAVE